jgi:hypothetical protein
MKTVRFILFLLIPILALSPVVFASNWIEFASFKEPATKWLYDKESITYSRAKEIVGIEIPRKDRNFPKVWIKSSGDGGEKPYQVELNCKKRTARLFDEGGKTLYSVNAIDYLYDKQIVPDSVLDSLRKSVCR